ncbi:bacteriocin-protection, YdeI or OmpD-associated-domain-containing protein [Mariannaea sp. PMI_226]|nr:bacteriocin-protection, YdeI or OmpD-associated-domain-containing protein [Mariannaea sp. PMI_226]
MPRQTRSSTKATISQPLKKSPDVSAAPTDLENELFENATAWETWLEANHRSHNGLWLRLAKKNADISSVTYDEALDAALCYGWIDGQRKSYDDQCFMQRFTPRRKNSIWSKRNVTKVAVLIETGLMKPSGQAEVDAAKVDGRWERAYSSSSNAEVPPDFQAALDANRHASEFFKTITRSQRYSFIFRLETAKRPDTRQRRIEQFVKLLEAEKVL